VPRLQWLESDVPALEFGEQPVHDDNLRGALARQVRYST
jgi:hypothetical protein